MYPVEYSYISPWVGLKPVFPLKLGKQGKYRALVCEYRTKLSELCIKDYVNTSRETMDVNTLPN